MNDRDDRTNAHPHGGPAPPALQIMEAALGYNHHGIAVLPLHTVVEGVCSCGDEDCTSAGKHPHVARGLKDASTDPEVIRGWWRKWPDSNIGIRTGAESGLIVLDIDPDHGGDASLAELERIHGPLPRTVQQATGGGGRHYVFLHPGSPVRNRAGFRPGLDVRGDGGYIVAPPSGHISGERYAWAPGCSPDEIELAALPAWLLDLITRYVVPHSESESDGDRAWHEGERNTRLVSHAGKLRRDGLSSEKILEVIGRLNQANCSPPLSVEEVRRIAKGITRYPPTSTPEELLEGLGVRSLSESFSPALLHLTLESIRQWRRENPPSTLEATIGTEVRRILKEAGVDRPAEVWDSTAPRPDSTQDHAESDKATEPVDPEIEALARELLRRPNLLDEMVTDTDRRGHVGEEVNRKMVLLAGVAGLTAMRHTDAIHEIIKGESSTGKNQLVRSVLDLLPLERSRCLTGLSPQALIYHGDMDGVLVIQENHGEEQADYVVRQAMSEGHVERLTVIDGSSHTVKAYIMASIITTTTSVAVNDENETRVFILHTDESSDLTRLVVNSEALRWAGVSCNQEQMDRTQQVWQCAMRQLKPAQVRVPFAHHIAESFPDRIPRARRDFQRVMNLLRACALLHQIDRERDDGGYLIATALDYSMVYPLLQAVLEPSMSGLNETAAALDQLVRALSLTGRPGTRWREEAWVRQPELITAASINNIAEDKTVRKWSKRLVEMGYWESRRAEKGGAWEFKPIRDVSLEPITIPRPADIERAMANEACVVDEDGGLMPDEASDPDDSGTQSVQEGE